MNIRGALVKPKGITLKQNLLPSNSKTTNLLQSGCKGMEWKALRRSMEAKKSEGLISDFITSLSSILKCEWTICLFRELKSMTNLCPPFFLGTVKILETKWEESKGISEMEPVKRLELISDKIIFLLSLEGVEITGGKNKFDDKI